jgi:GNAT superfamily N-acetyltransferase
MGPFFASPAVRKALGAAMSDGPDYVWIAAWRGPTIVGFCATEIRGDVAHHHHGYVVPDERGLGVYAAMMAHRDAAALRRGGRHAMIIANKNSAHALARAGYQDTGRRRGSYLVMEKSYA